MPSPHAMGGRAGEVPPALMQGTEGQCIVVLLPAALWPWGGEWGVYSPFLLALVPPSPSHRGRAEGLEALGAEVKTVL